MAGVPERAKAAEEDSNATATQNQTANGDKSKKDKPKKEPKQKPTQEPKQKQQKQQQAGKKTGGDVDEKGITTLKEQDLSQWYQEILLKGDFLEYSDIPGCYIINVRVGRRLSLRANETLAKLLCNLGSHTGFLQY